VVSVGGAGRYSVDWLIHGWLRARSFPDASAHLLRPVLGLLCIILPRRVYRFGSGAWAPAYRLCRNVSGTSFVESL
jgi:hypothetical protein